MVTNCLLSCDPGFLLSCLAEDFRLLFQSYIWFGKLMKHVQHAGTSMESEKCGTIKSL